MTHEASIPIDTALEERIRAIRLVVFDFDGVFTDNSVYVSQEGIEMVRCNRGDGIGLRQLEQAGLKTIIISGEVNPVVAVRSRKLNIRCIQGCDDKAKALEDIAGEMSLVLDQIAFVGNDINDLACLKTVGLPIVVQDAHSDVIPHARYRTQTPGGHGAVREVCDMFVRVLASNSE